MLKKRTMVSTFLVVFVLSILLLILSNFNVLNVPTSFLSKITTPFQKSIYSTFGLVLRQGNSNKLQEENVMLYKKIVDQEKLKEDNLALRDQFQITNPSSIKLLPSRIISFPGFIPNVSMPETLILDKGEADGVKIGQVVVFKDNLVGKVSNVLANKSLVNLITNPSQNFTARVLSSNASGIIKGLGAGEMILDNVLLSDALKAGDIILTKGDLTINGVNFPSDLIIGKITAVNKDPSALFQTAGVESLIDFSNLTMVFVYLE